MGSGSEKILDPDPVRIRKCWIRPIPNIYYWQFLLLICLTFIYFAISASLHFYHFNIILSLIIIAKNWKKFNFYLNFRDCILYLRLIQCWFFLHAGLSYLRFILIRIYAYLYRCLMSLQRAEKASINGTITFNICTQN